VADVWEDYAKEVEAIFGRCREALRSPVPGGMTYVEHRAALSRLATKTAEKLGKKREELAERFSKDEQKLKEMCGM
jgi:hypothetical protein